VRDESGRAVGKKAGLRTGQRLQTEFKDGIVPVRVE
jgi:exonuclease VII large subunit